MENKSNVFSDIGKLVTGLLFSTTNNLFISKTLENDQSSKTNNVLKDSIYWLILPN